MIVGCLLAGGRSTRMGGDEQKFRRRLGGLAIIERICRRLSPQVDQLLVSARGTGLEDLNLPVVFDTQFGAGPLAGIQAALEWVVLNHGAEALLLTVPADTPFLPSDLARRLAEERERSGAEISTAASVSGVHPTISLWPARLAPDLDARLKAVPTDRSVRGFIETRSTMRVFFEGPVDPFFNINRPSDLAEAERLLQIHASLFAQ
jgi:molybdopterin-guanine dinucleotide biosynthesis protein A